MSTGLWLGRYKAGMCDAAWCVPCTWAPLRWTEPTKGRYNKGSTFSFITDRRVYLSQVTYTPLHPQSVWTSDDVAPHPALVNYGGSALPHLRPNVASTAQTFAATPVAPVPRPPATVRSRPLSAGARNRQYRDRPATDPNNMPNTRYGEKSLLHYINFTSSWSK